MSFPTHNIAVPDSNSTKQNSHIQCQQQYQYQHQHSQQLQPSTLHPLHIQPQQITPATQYNTQHNNSNAYLSDESSMEDNADEQPETNEWQTVNTNKKRKRGPKSPTDCINTQDMTTRNRFSMLQNQTEKDDSTNVASSNKPPTIPKPPPIFIYGVTNYSKMIESLTEVAEIETYQCTALLNNTIKINTRSPDTYRRLIRHLNSNKIIHHTYQMKEERAYRVVIRNMTSLNSSQRDHRRTERARPYST